MPLNGTYYAFVSYINIYYYNARCLTLNIHPSTYVQVTLLKTLFLTVYAALGDSGNSPL